jgi:amino acid permease
MGKAVILPASHTGGRCYMIQNYHDSIAICRVFGPPDFFFTFTCHSNWPEIVNSYHGNVQRPSDKLDVIVRVYHMKLKELIQDIRCRYAPF